MQFQLLKRPLIVLILIILSYVIFLWDASVPLTGDQKVYLSIAREMFERHEWVIPYLFGEPNFLKPPFQYWATILGWKTFGFGMWGALFPSVLATVASAFAAYQIGKKLELKNPAIVPLVFASTLGTLTYGTTAQMEIWVVLFYLMGWLMILNRQIFSAFLVAGVMAWVKGPLYPVLFTGSVVVWDRTLLKEKKFWISLLSGAGVGLAWYGLAAKSHSSEMLKQFFYQENFGKLSTSHGSIPSLWLEFLASLFPWLPFFLVTAFDRSHQRLWKKNARFIVSFALIPALFFTFFPYRVNSYLYVLTPAVAWIVSEMEFENLKTGLRVFLLGFYGLFFSAGWFVLIRISNADWIHPSLQSWTYFGFAVSAAGVILGVLCRNRWGFAYGSLVFVLAIRLIGIGIGKQDLSGIRNDPDFERSSYVMVMDADSIWHESGWLSTALGKPVSVLSSFEEADRFLAQGYRLILQEQQMHYQKPDHNCLNWKRFNRRIHLPLQEFFSGRRDLQSADFFRNYRICSVRQPDSK